MPSKAAAKKALHDSSSCFEAQSRLGLPHLLAKGGLSKRGVTTGVKNGGTKEGIACLSGRTGGTHACARYSSGNCRRNRV